MPPPSVNVIYLYSRAQQLGDHAILYTRSNTLVKCPAKLCNLNVEEFPSLLTQRDVPLCWVMMVVLTNMPMKSLTRNIVNATTDKWDRLLCDSDDKRV